MAVPFEGVHEINLLGAFRLRARNGAAITIPSKKARAMIAVLALSRHGERSRAWLQNLLWCRCQRNEAQGNLRRELSNLLKLLSAAAPDLIETTRDSVRLRLDLCRVDALSEETGADRGQLLEGLDLAGEEEFEDWLREARADDGTGRRGTAHPTSAPMPTFPLASAQAPPAQDHRLSVSIQLEAWHDGSADADFLPELLRHDLALGLQETGYFRLIQDITGSRPETSDIYLRIKTTVKGDMLAIFIACGISTTGEMLFTMRDMASIGPGHWNVGVARIHEIASLCASRVVDRCIVNANLKDEPHLARKGLLSAVDQMFSLNRDEVHASRATLLQARGLESQSTFHAWKAYQAVFRHDVAHAYDYTYSLEECRHNMDIALGLDPFNGVALALCAHVHAFLFRDLESAWELLDRASATGTRNIMYFDALALLHFYSGRYETARGIASQTAMLGSNLSFRYCFSTTLCMIEARTGNFEAAVSHGQRALAMEPRNRQFSYPPTLRYLGASLAHSGKIAEARQTFLQMGDGALITPGGALPGIGGSDFISTALAKAGL